MFTEFIRNGTGNQILGATEYAQYVQMFSNSYREGSLSDSFSSAEFTNSIAKSKGLCLDISVSTSAGQSLETSEHLDRKKCTYLFCINSCNTKTPVEIYRRASRKLCSIIIYQIVAYRAL